MAPIAIELPKAEVSLDRGQYKEVGAGLKEYNRAIEERGSKDKPKATVDFTLNPSIQPRLTNTQSTRSIYQLGTLI